MQEVITKEIKIINDWQMYRDCGISMNFLYEDIHGEIINVYLPYSIKMARENADWFFSEGEEEEDIEKGSMLIRMIDYFQTLGFEEDEEIFIRIDY